MLILGLTGGIATGKSTVSQLFRDKGLTVIDCDEIAHLVTKKVGHVHDYIHHLPLRTERCQSA